jgi:hypothetical protein
VVGLLAFGEGWHNNQHAFPRSAFHGLRWWQFDLSAYIIRLLEWSGLAWNVCRVPAERLAARNPIAGLVGEYRSAASVGERFEPMQRTGSILIVDSEPAIVDLLFEVLTDAGYMHSPRQTSPARSRLSSRELRRTCIMAKTIE